MLYSVGTEFEKHKNSWRRRDVISLVLTSRRGGGFRYKGRILPLESVRRELTGHFEKLLVTDDFALTPHTSSTLFHALSSERLHTQVNHLYLLSIRL